MIQRKLLGFWMLTCKRILDILNYKSNMDFFSPIFFGFFIIVLLIYYSVSGKDQKLVILLSSSLFIGLISLSVLFFTYLFILVNYGIASMMEKYHQNANLKRFFYQSGIFLNIGSLVFFKYFNWILESIFQVVHFFNFYRRYPGFKYYFTDRDFLLYISGYRLFDPVKQGK